jgi:tetratricopeptide (TPR) repeat protein
MTSTSLLLAMATSGCGGNPRHTGQSWRDIEAALKRGGVGEVNSRLQEWTKQHPADAKGWLTLATFCLSRDEREPARAALERIAKTDRLWPTAQGLLGEVAYKSRDAPRAEAHWRAAAEADAKATVPRRRLVSLLALELRNAEARDFLWQLLDLTHDPGILFGLVGEPLLAETDTRGLERDLRLFLTRTPDDPFLRRALGICLVARGKSAEAIPHLEAAMASLVDDPVGRFALAEARIAQGVALDDVVPLLAPAPYDTRPDNADPTREHRWLLRARLLEAAGDLEGAITSLRLVINSAPGHREAHFRLGNLLERRQSPDAGRHLKYAEQLHARQLALRRAHLRARREGLTPARCEELATLCRDLGLKREAEAWLNLALVREPGRESAQTALAQSAGSSPVEPLVFFHQQPKRTLINPSSRRPWQTEPPPPQSPPQHDCPIRFEEIAPKSGVSYAYDCAPRGDLFIGETMGGGVLMLDYDNDGFLDLYFVNGVPWPNQPGKLGQGANKLYRNRGNLAFEDVTTAAGVPGRGYGMGGAAADYDNDGDVDLFVTGLGSTALYRNHGDGTFEDVTRHARVSSALWSTAAGFADLDSDGDLDLVVVTYLDASPHSINNCVDHSGRKIHCPPAQFPAQPDLLYRNNGDGTFTDISVESGISSADNGRGLGLAIVDLDDDGRLDIFVANDGSANFAFRNLGNLGFEELAHAMGLAYDGSGRATASMGVVAADLDQDQRLDLFHTNFINEPNTLRHNLGQGLFSDTTIAAGLSGPSLAKTGFGAAALDADNDGNLDLFITNGHVDNQPWIGTPMAQAPLFHQGKAGGRFTLPNLASSPYFARGVVGRGAVCGDLDNDGRQDLVVVHRDAPVAILRNITEPSGHWIGIRLKPTRGATPPVGTRIECAAAGRMQTRWVTSGTGYLSQHDTRLWFGLGSSSVVDQLTVTWPGGRQSTLVNLASDRIIDIAESDATP